MKFVISEDEKKRILNLHEQNSDKVMAVPLTQNNFKELNPTLQKSVLDSIFGSDQIVSKLNIDDNMKNQSVIDFLNKNGVTPYLFNKHISGTGEKFGMVGLYLDLYGDDVKLKLNLNNVSEYMLNSMPWALLSLNIPLK